MTNIFKRNVYHCFLGAMKIALPHCICHVTAIYASYIYFFFHLFAGAQTCAGVFTLLIKRIRRKKNK